MEPPAYAALLSRLSADDCKFLDNCITPERTSENHKEDVLLGDSSYLFYAATGEHAQFGTGTDTYMYAEGLINHALELGFIRTEIPRRPEPASHTHFLTPLGLDFLRTWRKQKQAGASA